MPDTNGRTHTKVAVAPIAPRILIYLPLSGTGTIVVAGRAVVYRHYGAIIIAAALSSFVYPTCHDLECIIRQRPLQRHRLIPRRSHPYVALFVSRQDHPAWPSAGSARPSRSARSLRDCSGTRSALVLRPM